MKPMKRIWVKCTLLLPLLTALLLTACQDEPVLHTNPAMQEAMEERIELGPGKLYLADIPKPGCSQHIVGWKSDDTHHYQRCSRCGAELSGRQKHSADLIDNGYIILRGEMYIITTGRCMCGQVVEEICQPLDP